MHRVIRLVCQQEVINTPRQDHGGYLHSKGHIKEGHLTNLRPRYADVVAVHRLPPKHASGRSFLVQGINGGDVIRSTKRVYQLMILYTEGYGSGQIYQSYKVYL